MLRIGADGWLQEGARNLASPHADERPDGTVIDLCVIHNISLPAGRYGGDAIESLFLGTLDCGQDPSFADLQGLRVSSHFLIRRDGEIVQFVSTHRRAWHAGVSQFMGRSACNDFSIGIELEGCDADRFEASQMAQLARLLAALKMAMPSLAWMAGHSEIAPGRKTDPGPHFDWQDLGDRMRSLGCELHRPG
jgi:AmpD protein